jgi:DNA helicase HerA-like ATPase
MTTSNINFDDLRNLTIGTVESVSPREIRVLLDLNAPQNTAINTGIPTLFPKINGYVLLPNEAGALIGMISWIGIEHSSYPKRKGFKDFDLVDLPFPLRKMSISPLGILKKENKGYKIERGVYSYPSVGDAVVIPTHEQLQSIVENKDENAKIKIGNSPLAANAPVYVDPDKLFGRHVAVLGNTGSGKSCSVAGLIRWSLEAVKNEIEPDKNPNVRFIILDPNGEYTKTFDGISGKVKIFKVAFDEKKAGFEQLEVPAWMWNSYEWSSISQASGRTQRPVLRRALRELRSGHIDSSEDEQLKLRRYLSSNLVSFKNSLNYGDYKTEATKLGFLLKSVSADLTQKRVVDTDITTAIAEASERLAEITKRRYKTFFDKVTEDKVEYYVAFEENDIEEAISSIESILEKVGGISQYKGPDEDSPVYFKDADLPNHLERLAQEQNVQQFLDFLIMRVRTMLSDTRMSSIIGTETDISLTDWLEKYVGKNNAENGEITVVDLSLVPPDIIHIVVAVMARIIFEAIQRYKRKYAKLLPTVLVMEEAHNFISRYNTDNEEFSPSRLCSQSFEKIAKEGRKFGLGLLLSSQRPSELSPTVLSQCNTFLLHRLVNDRDQELVKRFVPDNLGSILNELPVLPTKKAILLGWAAPVPILVDMNELKKEHQPDSKDPDFWNVWTGKEERKIDWKEIVDEWQKEGNNEENK